MVINMEFANLAHKILDNTVLLMQDFITNYINGEEKERYKKAIIQLLKITKAVLYIQDTKKSPSYKIAILVEFFETLITIMEAHKSPIHTELMADLVNMFKYIDQIKSNAILQEELILAIEQRLDHFYDFDSIVPELVTFWLDSSCNLESLRCMQAFMFFVPKSMHQAVVKHDISLHEDKSFELLLECVKTLV